MEASEELGAKAVWHGLACSKGCARRIIEGEESNI